MYKIGDKVLVEGLKKYNNKKSFCVDCGEEVIPPRPQCDSCRRQDRV